MQVFHSTARTKRELFNTWVRCNNFTVDVHLEGGFKAVVSQACRGAGKGFLDSQCTVSEETAALHIK